MKLEKLNSIEDFEILSQGDLISVNGQSVVYDGCESKEIVVIRRIDSKVISRTKLKLERISILNGEIRCSGAGSMTNENLQLYGEGSSRESFTKFKDRELRYQELNNKLTKAGL